MKFTLATAALVVACANAKKSLHAHSTYAANFVSHVETHNLEFSTEEDYSAALTAFKHNSDLIELHNNGDHTYTLGHNQFSHLSFEEFAATYLAEPAPRKESSRFINAFEGVVADDAKDWSTSDAVTAVKDQGSCGSCWAFSTTGGMEGAYFLKNNKQVAFSEQQLVSCDTASGDMGCNGGLMDNAFGYIKTEGLCAESDYPYASGGGSAPSCESSCTPVDGTVGITFTDVANSEDALVAAVTQQPISVAVDADFHWQLYKGGIMTHVSGTQLDHGVLAVGFGTEGSDGFWKIKNSWADAWGEDGYIRIARSDQTNGPCGITSSASYPTLAASSLLDVAAPSGSYSGSDTVLGLTASATVTVIDDKTVDMAMTGAVSLACNGEKYTLAEDGSITLDNIGDDSDCVKQGMDDNHVTLQSIKYDEAADTITIESKVTVVSTTIVMTKDKAVAEPTAVLM